MWVGPVQSGTVLRKPARSPRPANESTDYYLKSAAPEPPRAAGANALVIG